MRSWWRLGEGVGRRGDSVRLNDVTCPFCDEIGNFDVAHEATKKKPNSEKALHFDTWKCSSCAGYVQVFWSAAEDGGLYDFKVMPWPLRYNRHPESWPDSVGRFWQQAKRNLSDENWDAAAVMARSALQAALRDQKAEGSNLKQEIDNLAANGILPPMMKDWSTNVRELGNDAAHPRSEQAPVQAADAEDIVHFLDFLLEYLYELPDRISRYRGRSSGGGD